MDRVGAEDFQAPVALLQGGSCTAAPSRTAFTERKESRGRLRAAVALPRSKYAFHQSTTITGPDRVAAKKPRPTAPHAGAFPHMDRSAYSGGGAVTAADDGGGRRWRTTVAVAHPPYSSRALPVSRMRRSGANGQTHGSADRERVRTATAQSLSRLLPSHSPPLLPSSWAQPNLNDPPGAPAPDQKSDRKGNCLARFGAFQVQERCHVRATVAPQTPVRFLSGARTFRRSPRRNGLQQRYVRQAPP